MKNYYLSLLLFCFTIAFHGQIVNIPDANFKAKLLAAAPGIPIATGTNGYISIDTNGNSEIEVSEALLVRALDVKNSSINSLEGISSFTNLRTLVCDNNNLTTLDLNSLVNLNTLFCSHNQLISLNAELIYDKFKYLDCSYNNLTALIVPNFFPFQDMGSQTLTFNCSYNQLSQITFDQSNGSEEFSGLNLENNNFTELDLSNIKVYGGSASVSNNPLTNLNLTNFYVGPADPDDTVSFRVENTNLTQLTIPRNLGNSWCTVSIKNNPNLVSLNLKNGGQESLILENNPLLGKICCDSSETDYVVSLAPSAQVSEFCNFAPGGNYNTIVGSVMLNCPTGNFINSNIKVAINNTLNASFIQGQDSYIAYTGIGNKTVILNLPNPNYFTVTPFSYNYNFTNYGNIETANFCVTANGVHPDLEVTILPLTPSRPGFDSTYKIIYTNKGNQMQDGAVAFNFNDAVLDLITANPTVNIQSSGTLSWNFINLAPFESRTIVCTFNVNSPQETPAVNIGDLLDFSGSITAVNSIEETPNDNNFSFSQTVIGSYDPNDKLVTEGSVIDISKVGDHLHYMIRFQNTGTAAAENVVVKDILPNNLDARSIQMITSSHPYRSTLANNKLEFIFEGINLPASSIDEPGSNGFVAFKVKPTTNVGLGSIIENNALIYFDFNFPIVTNTTSTTVATLGTQNFDDSNFTLYPNPAQNKVNIAVTNGINIQKISFYNMLGQIVKTIAISELKASPSVDVSSLKTGTYFIEINSNQGKTTKKFVKL